ncbi:ABC transporter ATP-binding protein [Nibricoccus aquaticus]|uniref:ABC transporter ATP-binding protein n=1 Tax=Nibricoccus aquaticus TaxID=2576891 RepID=A0A290Q7Y3_9BACT|nr:ABC transporter ATP-binding protein [Nibricoccus aquaticus]ATC63280.1 ABC transporter ATP-binding protein [Nibricoccus aquaticus]
MSQPIIEASNISKKYRLGQIGMTSLRDDVQRLGRRLRGIKDEENSERDFWALRDVGFQIHPGEVVGIIGRNGAGKSTLLKVLSRITEPTTGEIVLRGRVGSLLEVGTGFHPELSGRENVFLNGAILGMRREEIARKFDEIVAFSEIGKFIDTPVKRYSSGMYVRLAFAIAAHLEPEILIIDEVLAVGDQAFQEKCIGKMQQVANSHGRTILFVSHHMSAVRRLCQKCIVLDKGRASPLLGVEEAVDRYNAAFRKGESGRAVDTSALPRDHGKGTLCKITQINALGETGLSYGEPMNVELTIECTQTVKDLMVGLAFETLEGSRVLTLDSDAAQAPVTLPAGRHVIRLHLDQLPLHPAQYIMSASAAAGAHYFDVASRFAIWEVTTSRKDKVSDRGFGACRIPPTVTVQTL